MTDKHRRRDLTVKLRHKDVGLVVQAKHANRRERRRARSQISRDLSDTFHVDD